MSFVFWLCCLSIRKERDGGKPKLAVGRRYKPFGFPIGSFQVIQHHCADMLIDTDTSRWVTYQAAWMPDQGVRCEKKAAIAFGDVDSHCEIVAN